MKILNALKIMYGPLIIFVFLAAPCLAAEPYVQITISDSTGVTLVEVFMLIVDTAPYDVATMEILQSDGSTTGLCTIDMTVVSPAPGQLFKSLSFQVDVSTPATPVFTGAYSTCYVSPTASNWFQFTLRSRKTAGSTDPLDKTFVITYDGTDWNQRNNDGELVMSTTTHPPTEIVTKSTYTSTLQVADGSGNPVSFLAMNDAATLRYTLVVSPQRAGLDNAGARVVSCVMDKVNTFDSGDQMEIIGGNGCAVRNGWMYNEDTSTFGFAKHGDTNYNGVTLVKTYVAVTSSTFEMAPYLKVTPTGNNYVYVKCELEFDCWDDTDGATAGQCGANHCNSGARRKRSISDAYLGSVMTAIEIRERRSPKDAEQELPASTEQPVASDDLCACPDDALLYGSMSGLGAVAAILFGMMLITYLDLHRTYMSCLDRSESDSKVSPRSHGVLPTRSAYTGSVKSYYA